MKESLEVKLLENPPENIPEVFFFAQKPWLEAQKELLPLKDWQFFTLQVAPKGSSEALAYLPFGQRKSLGKKRGFEPLFTPYNGPIILTKRESFSSKSREYARIVEALSRYLKRRFSDFQLVPWNQDLRPWQALGWRVKMQQHLRVDLKRWVAGEMDSDTRRAIKKAQDLRVVRSPASEVEVLPCYQETWMRSKETIPRWPTFRDFRKIGLQTTLEEWHVVDANNNLMGGVSFWKTEPENSPILYLWHIYNSRNGAKHRANFLLLDEIFQWAYEKGYKEVDLGAGHTPGLQGFKDQFAHHVVHKPVVSTQKGIFAWAQWFHHRPS